MLALKAILFASLVVASYGHSLEKRQLLWPLGTALIVLVAGLLVLVVGIVDGLLIALSPVLLLVLGLVYLLLGPVAYQFVADLLWDLIIALNKILLPLRQENLEPPVSTFIPSIPFYQDLQSKFGQYNKGIRMAKLK